MDLSKLSPAPWVYDERVGALALYSGPRVNCFYELDSPIIQLSIHPHSNEWLEKVRADFSFAALARNAFDVMQRRGWGVKFCEYDHEWWIEHRNLRPISFANWCCENAASDPFTILVNADAWYRENVDI